jgi:hypothetical protein
LALQSDLLLERIEICRRKMVELAVTTSFTNYQVVELSVELDMLLNDYNLLMNKGSNS